jgi:hypothetical protein
MNLECLNGIITDNLAIQIDLTQLKSWDLNTDFTSYSLTKWTGAVSDNINLIDFGLTGFDNGRTNKMWSGYTLTPQDNIFSMYRIGYNVVKNPTTGETSGMTITTEFDPYYISGVTTGNSGNYFELNGGYLQGFFKLQGYNYELLPARYNNGITVETLVYLNTGSSGIFYMMGVRAEDKYNPHFSGESTLNGVVSGGTIVDVTKISGVTTSENNYLDAYQETLVNREAFIDWGDRKRKEYFEAPPITNVTGNTIAFFLTADRRLGYKYIDNKGIIVQNISPRSILHNATGWTMIDIAFIPNATIDDSILISTWNNGLFSLGYPYSYNYQTLIDCAPQRIGTLIFYINGRSMWTINDFPEYFFKGLKNQREKQIGVPFSISWGGGSFGLRYSYHYDYQKYELYDGQNTAYINQKFWVQNNPLPDECEPPASDDYLPGLSLSADSSTFMIIDKCDPHVEHPYTVMRVEFTGTTGITGTSAMTYFIKFNQPISVLSNRDYEVDLSFFNSGFSTNLRAKLLVYGTVDIDIINETQYSYPFSAEDIIRLEGAGIYPFPDRQEYQYMRDGIMYYGATGLPVLLEDALVYGLISVEGLPEGSVVTGLNSWKPLKLVFRTADNSGQQHVYLGLLLESSEPFNENSPIFINNFTYKGADILVKDPKKNDLLIQENFDSSFIGGIQKLRVYNNGLTSEEILHNALIEAKSNPNLKFKVNKGGRIIYR